MTSEDSSSGAWPEPTMLRGAGIVDNVPTCGAGRAAWARFYGSAFGRVIRMMNQESASARAPSGFRRPAGGAQTAKFGAQHAWAFDMPALAEFSNSPGAKSAVSAGLGELDTRHAWAFDVPAQSESSNSPRPAVAVADVPQNGIAGDFWVVSFETGNKTGS